eukprot:GHVR01133763.1.p1 GENE.GHVR01133763.1~~GHVR01133763.1.p1  ORF type:complete len:162 (-),score=7.66 GHVR01133763.1:221-706(-)
MILSFVFLLLVASALKRDYEICSCNAIEGTTLEDSCEAINGDTCRIASPSSSLKIVYNGGCSYIEFFEPQVGEGGGNSYVDCNRNMSSVSQSKCFENDVCSCLTLSNDQNCIFGILIRVTKTSLTNTEIIIMIGVIILCIILIGICIYHFYTQHKKKKRDV